MDIDEEDKEMAQHAGETLNFKNLLIGLDEPSSESNEIESGNEPEIVSIKKSYT